MYSGIKMLVFWPQNMTRNPVSCTAKDTTPQKIIHAIGSLKSAHSFNLANFLRMGILCFSTKQRSKRALSSPLFPGLPDHVSLVIITRLPYSSLCKFRAVNNSWRHILQSRDFRQLKLKCGVSSKWIITSTETTSGMAIYAYDPVSSEWHRLPDMPDLVRGKDFTGFCFSVLQGKLFVIGGMENDKVTSSVRVFDFSTSCWSFASSMVNARSWCAASVVGDSIIVTGGQGASSFLKSTEVYDIKRNSWTLVADMSVARSSHQMLTLNGRVWAIAGECERHQTSALPTQSYKGSAEVYSPASKTWKTVLKMWPHAESKVPGPCTVTGNQIISAHMGHLIQYNEESNEWTRFGCLPGVSEVEQKALRWGFGLLAINGILYTFGGCRLIGSMTGSSHCKKTASMDMCDVAFLETSQLQNVHEKVFTFKPVVARRRLGWKSASHMPDFGGAVLASAVLEI